MAYLVSKTGKRFPLKEGTQTIGRETTNQIVVPSVSVSRCHARVDVKEGDTRLFDLDSTNGTTVNGTRITQTVLKPGDVVSFGDVSLTFRAESLVEQTLSNIKRLRDDGGPAEESPKTAVPGPSAAMLSDVRSRLDKLDRSLRPGGKAISDTEIATLRTELDEARKELAQNSALFDQLRASRDRMVTLLEISRALNSILDTTELLSAVMDMALAVMKAERGFIMLHDPLAKTLTPKIARQMSADIHGDETGTFSRSIAEKVFRTGQTVSTTDAQDDFDTSRSVVNFAIKSAVCVPLSARGETCGVLYVDTQQKAVGFSKDDTMFLESLGAQASIALENAHLYEELAEQKKSIESIVNSMADAVLVADADYSITLMNPAARRIFDPEAVRGADVKLRMILDDVKAIGKDCTQNIVLMKPERIILENSVTYLEGTGGRAAGLIMVMRNVTDYKNQERARAEFLSFVAHKLNEPLDALRKQARDLLPDAQPSEEGLNRIRTEVEFFRELAVKLLYFAELGAGPLRLSRKTSDLRALVAKAAETLRPLIAEKDIRIVEPAATEDAIKMKVDDQRLSEAVGNLFLNALAVTPPQGEIGYGVEAGEKHARISVWDTGETPDASPPEAQVDKDLFIDDIVNTRTQTARRSNIRMAFVRHILEAHGGTVAYEKDAKNGRNVVRLELPRWQK